MKHAIEVKVEWQLFPGIDTFLPEIYFSQVLIILMFQWSFYCKGFQEHRFLCVLIGKSLLISVIFLNLEEFKV